MKIKEGSFFIQVYHWLQRNYLGWADIYKAGCLQILKNFPSLKTHIGLKITNSQTSLLFPSMLHRHSAHCMVDWLLSNTEITNEFLKKIVYK